MDGAKRGMILPGVWLTTYQTKKFKTGYFSLHLVTPLEEETAAITALLPLVLRRGTNRYPDLERISALLEELYGGVVEPSIRKRGENQCVGFAASFLDDAYAHGEPVSARAIGLLGDLLLRPETRNGRFRSEYVEGEVTNLRAMMAAQVNDKAQYAHRRLVEEMCRGEAYGTDRLGRAETLDKMNNRKLFEHWLRLLKRAPIELYYCGSQPRGRIAAAWKEALTGLPRNSEYDPPLTVRPVKPETVRDFSDALDVSQAKLELGFRTGILLDSPDYPALLVMNAAFGGSTNSRLFLHVREKLSLCYYASSSVDKHAGLLFVRSGVEFANLDRAKAEILAQLEVIRDGQLTEQELNAAKKSVITGLRSAVDGQSALESFSFSQSLAGLDYGPEELALLVSEVTAGQVSAAAQRLTLDACYVLKGNAAEPVPEQTSQEVCPA